jgi:hypothetical protein
MQTRCPVDGADGGQCLARDVGRELLDVSPAGGDEGGDAGTDRGPTRVDGDPLHGLLDDVDGPPARLLLVLVAIHGLRPLEVSQR